MERIAIDHMYAKQHLGFDGEEVVLMCVDLFSGLCAACPAGDRSTQNVEEALRFFAGRNRPIVTVVSDRAPEFAKAISNCGFVADPAPPRDVLHNPHAESAIRTFRQGVSTLMLQSGLNQQYWPYAIKYFEFAYNVLSPPSGPAIRNSERRRKLRHLHPSTKRLWGILTKDSSFPSVPWSGTRTWTSKVLNPMVHLPSISDLRLWQECDTRRLIGFSL